MPIGNQTEEEFANILSSSLSTSEPIDSVEHLLGREKHINAIRQALYTKGRHIFIYGDRGVGKSSLAHTAAIQYQSPDKPPIFINCSPNSTFKGILESLITKMTPTTLRGTNFWDLKFGVSGNPLTGELSADYQVTQQSEASPTQKPNETYDFDRLTDLVIDIASKYSKKSIVVIDEFDVIDSGLERAQFSYFIKNLGDKKAGIKLIFSGIASSLDQLLGAHLSSIRHLETIELERLGFQARWEILEHTLSKFDIGIDKSILIRIAGISDGFPHYVHLISEKLMWYLFNNKPDATEVSWEDYYCAIDEAVARISPQLKKPYEEATKNRAAEYHHLLWAAADAYDLARRTENIYLSHKAMIEQINSASGDGRPNLELLKQEFVYRRLTNLRKSNYGSILKSVPNRKGWYQFSENMVRGYVRLVAEKHGVTLDVTTLDSPPMPKTHVPRQKQRHVYHRPYYQPDSYSRGSGKSIDSED